MKRTSKLSLENLFQRARRQFAYAEDAQRSKMDEIIENMAFYRGFQFSLIGSDSQTDVAGLTGEQSVVQNICLPLIRASVATRLRNRPNPEIAPAKGDQKSRAKAKNISMLARAFSTNGVIDTDELYRALVWAQIAGGAWIKTMFNPKGGKPSLSLDPLSKDMFADQPEFVVTYPGEIETSFVPTTDLLPDPTATCPRELRYVFHQRLIPVDRLDDIYPEDVYGKKTRGRWDTGSVSDTQHEYREIAEMADEFVGSSEFEGDELARVVELWAMPVGEYELGIHSVFSGNMLVTAGHNPKWPTRLPFTLIYGDNLLPGSLYAEGLIKQIKPLQREINRSASQIAEHVHNVLHTHLLANRASNIAADEVGNISGQIIEYDGVPPQFAAPPPIPGGLFDYSEQLLSRSKEITGYSDISQGDAPAGITSGRAIAFLRENEQGIREPDMALWRRSYLNILQQAVYEAHQNYEDGQMVRIVGDDFRYTQLLFRQDDFDWDNDIIPEMYSGAPSSYALRFSETIEMLKEGIFDPNNPAAKAALHRLGADYAGASTFDPVQEDREKAERENTQFLTVPGFQEMPASFDDHVTHIEEHNRVRKSQAYEDLDPQVKFFFDYHCDTHEQYLRGQVMDPAQGAMGTDGMMQPMPEAEGMVDGGMDMSGLPEFPGGGGAPVGGGHSTYAPGAPGADMAQGVEQPDQADFLASEEYS